MGDRTVLHCDLNAFFASAECLSHPELRTVPMAVCGDPNARHGIILAKNELAKRKGVVTAETISSALRKCPELTLVGAHHARYVELSRTVGKIYADYTDLIEPFGIDESWLDVTGSRSLFGDGETIANTLRERVRRETGLTISVGVSFCKVFAKLGSDLKKPDATTIIPRESFRDIVWPLPASDMLFVGKTAAAELRRARIYTIGDLAAADPGQLQKLLGKLGLTLSRCARGEDDSPVRHMDDRDPPKSVGNGLTFARDLTGESEFYSGIMLLSDEVAVRLRRAGMVCRTVQLQIKSPDLRVISRQRTLEYPSALSREIAAAAMEIMREAWKPDAPVRALTVTAQNLAEVGSVVVQPSLFDDAETERRRERSERLESAIDVIRGMYGSGAVVFGAAARGNAIQNEASGKKAKNRPQKPAKNG